jgi:hypothetical protein
LFSFYYYKKPPGYFQRFPFFTGKNALYRDFTPEKKEAFHRRFIRLMAGAVSAFIAVGGILCAIISVVLNPYKGD